MLLSRKYTACRIELHAFNYAWSFRKSFYRSQAIGSLQIEKLDSATSEDAAYLSMAKHEELADLHTQGTPKSRLKVPFLSKELIFISYAFRLAPGWRIFCTAQHFTVLCTFVRAKPCNRSCIHYALNKTSLSNSHLRFVFFPEAATNNWSWWKSWTPVWKILKSRWRWLVDVRFIWLYGCLK